MRRAEAVKIDAENRKKEGKECKGSKPGKEQMLKW